MVNFPYRLKTRPEYRPLFTSVSMFYRALDMISTSRYRLPVRRFIIDLFDVPLDPQVVQQLVEYSRTLKAVPSKSPKRAPNSRVVSVLFPPPRHNESESDEEDEMPKAQVQRPKGKDDAPVISLRPAIQIVGFGDDSD